MSATGVSQLDGPRGRGLGERRAQRRARVDEAGAGQVQPHQLHQHLVGVGGAVERAGAGAVVGGGLGGEQLVAADLAGGVLLAHLALQRVGQPGGHRARGHEQRGQVPERQRADQEARHDLVADAEHERGVEHVVREGDGGGHGDDVAAVERQLHARAALRDAVAHGGHAARELGGAARVPCGRLDLGREVVERLVGREHVVVAGHDRDVRRGRALELVLVGAARREAVGEVGAAEPAAGRALLGRGAHALEVGAAGGGAAFGQTSGDVGDHGVGHAISSCQVRPSRSISAVAAAGPAVPAG